MADNPFIGTWRLVSYITEKDGEISHTMGENASGYITYGADGYMSVALMSANRTLFDSPSSRAGSDEDKAAAFDGYTSYAGPYTVGEEAVTHHVEVAWFPNMVGKDNVRPFKFDGNQVTLSVPPVVREGVEVNQHLVWERV